MTREGSPGGLRCESCRERGALRTMCGEAVLCATCEERHFSMCLDCQDEEELLAAEMLDPFWDEDPRLDDTLKQQED